MESTTSRRRIDQLFAGFDDLRGLGLLTRKDCIVSYNGIKENKGGSFSLSIRGRNRLRRGKCYDLTITDRYAA
jgi:hypothetical protein